MLNTLQIIDLSLYLLVAALYIPVIVNALRGMEGHQVVHYLLGLYALIGLFLGVGEALWRAELIAIGRATFLAYQTYAAFLLSLVMLLVISFFLRRQGWFWLIVAGVLVVILFLVVQNVFGLPRTIWSNGTWSLPRDDLPTYLIILGWLVFNISAMAAVRWAYRRSKQPLYRNRLMYWLPFFILIITNDVFIFIRNPLLGNFPRLVAAWLMGYVVLTHDPPDMRQIMRRVLIYVITTLLIVAFYVAGFTLSQTLFQALPNFNTLVVGALIALVLATLFTPLLSLVRRWVDRWLHLEQFDPSRTLQEYGQSISNILEMQRLASVAVGLIIESLGITRGFLFLVDQDPVQDENKTYFLRAVRSPGERRIKPGILPETSPITQYFTREQRPLLQYDMDLLPSFRSVTRPERQWFNATQSEVYVPIFAKRRWIGLLAFGPKLSGNRYTEQDLVTLSALANQTAVALENARLVDNLVRLNQELRQAYHSLDRVNRDLERIDRTKSDFISIASHELRTPLTVMRGYTEMLRDDTSLNPEIQTIMKGLHDGTMRLHEIMDSMFDIAQLDARTLQLNLQSVDVADLVREVCFGLTKQFAERSHTLTIDLPALPHIKADPNILHKLFFHLVSNAIKYTPDDGKINITGQTLQPGSSESPEGGVQITVSDTGVGVAPEYRELIFTKFYQPGELGKHSTSKSRFQGGGAGLGLALAKGIAEAHGGRIWVESPGYDEVHFPGSKFHVLLPSQKSRKDEGVEMGREIQMTL
ncbi:MAG: GAF domain-containing sensor histidine kinase [Anaerolineales bacterium]|jgi:signal transduction histidine kinase